MLQIVFIKKTESVLETDSVFGFYCVELGWGGVSCEGLGLMVLWVSVRVMELEANNAVRSSRLSALTGCFCFFVDDQPSLSPRSLSWVGGESPGVSGCRTGLSPLAAAYLGNQWTCIFLMVPIYTGKLNDDMRPTYFCSTVIRWRRSKIQKISIWLFLGVNHLLRIRNQIHC